MLRDAVSTHWIAIFEKDQNCNHFASHNKTACLSLNIPHVAMHVYENLRNHRPRIEILCMH